jgi:endoglucanase
MILLPGTNYTAVGDLVSQGSAAALSTVVNLDGSTTNLIFDVHQYLDSDYTGTHSTCAYNGVSGLTTLYSWLSENNRQAYVFQAYQCIFQLTSVIGY